MVVAAVRISGARGPAHCRDRGTRYQAQPGRVHRYEYQPRSCRPALNQNVDFYPNFVANPLSHKGLPGLHLLQKSETDEKLRLPALTKGERQFLRETVVLEFRQSSPDQGPARQAVREPQVAARRVGAGRRHLGHGVQDLQRQFCHHGQNLDLAALLNGTLDCPCRSFHLTPSGVLAY